MRPWLAALAALTALRLALCASVPLTPDETYYFLWSQHLQTGYFDHPPMVAYLMRASTIVLGPTPLGIRLFGPILAAFGSVLLWDAGENLFPNRRAGLAAAALLNATLMLGAGSIIMTPDTPLLFFWTAGIAALARLLASGNPRWWLGVGLCAGLALLSKYTAALFVAGVFIWLLTQREGRRALLTPWPWAGILLALLAFAPDIFWNATHGWASWFKQGGRVAHFAAARSLQYLAELIFGQIGLFTPVIFILAAVGTWRLGAARSRAGWLMFWLTLIPVLVFLEHVLSGRVQANWPAIFYPSACLAAAALPSRVLKIWLKPALASGFAVTALVYIQALAAPFPISAKADPTALQFAGWKALSQQADAAKPAFLTSDDYATASALAYYGSPGVPVAGFASAWDPRWAYFSLPPAQLNGKTGILVTRRLDAICPVQLGALYRKRKGQIVDTYRLCRFTAPNPGVRLFP